MIEASVAEDFTDAHDDIDEVEEVDSLISLGETLGVDLEPMEIEFVRDEVRCRIGRIEDHLEAQQRDREPRLLDRHEEETARSLRFLATGGRPPRLRSQVDPGNCRLLGRDSRG